MNEIPQVYVVDDDDVVLLSVEALLTQCGYVVQCFSSAAAFLANCSYDGPGCVVTDIFMPGITGIELQQRLHAAGSILSIIVVTGVADVPTAVKAMEQGAVTLLEKPYRDADLAQAVERGLESSRQRWGQRERQRAVESRLALLTTDECDVLKCILAGKQNKQIAYALGMSYRTVDRRRQAIFHKLEASSVAELALIVGASSRTPDDSNAAPT